MVMAGRISLNIALSPSSLRLTRVPLPTVFPAKAGTQGYSVVFPGFPLLSLTKGAGKTI
jgi:hypothetical protein